ncbi:MAG: hypothetical protein RLZZ500_643 [Bacteroidota bacterium]|jgi:AraC family transcriptional regulator
MEPKIVWVPESHFVGLSRSFSFLNYQVGELWQSFMPRRHEIQNTVNSNLYNVQVNPENYNFDPATVFQKWAVKAVPATDNLPEGMQVLTIPAGKYAVFTYRGDGSNVADFFRAIYSQWLPQAGLQWENRPQFEVLGEQYKKSSPDSEELIYIPIRDE